MVLRPFFKSQMEMDEKTFFDGHGLNQYRYNKINSHTGKAKILKK